MSGGLLERLNADGRAPTPPGVVLRILELTRREDVPVQEVADTIAMDPGLTAKILRFVNSPMAGLSREVTSLKQAVLLMGMRGVKMMALSFSILSSTKRSKCPGFDQEHFAVYALACGTAARVLATTTKACAGQDAFSAGLLSQLGRSILAASFPEEYSAVLAKAQRVPADLPPLEREAFGDSYATVGADILRSWGLPEPLCESVALFRDVDADGRPAARVLQVAELAADLVCPENGVSSVDPREYLQHAEALLGIDDDPAIAMLAQVAKGVEEMRTTLQVSKATLRSPDEIEREVRERIAELSLAMHLENQCMAQQQEELLRRATTDALTGIGNRAAFDARLTLEIERSIRDGSFLALLMMDIDRFKKLNDTYGHQAGDRALQAVAKVLDENVRKVDYLARYGGEEFAVIAPGAKEESAIFLADRLRQCVENLTIPWDGRQLNPTISAGVAVLVDASDARVDGSKLIKAADQQLYAAKRNGRNRVEAAGRLEVAVTG